MKGMEGMMTEKRDEVREISRGKRGREVVVIAPGKGVGRRGPRRTSRTEHQVWNGQQWTGLAQ